MANSRISRKPAGQAARRAGAKPALGRPPGADGRETREAILDAALEAFAGTGYEAMSVRELTRQLGVSHTLVNHYFGSKWELWRAAVEHGFGEAAGEIRGMLERNVGRPDPVDVIRTSVRRALALLARRPAVARILAEESARGGERLAFLYENFLEPGVVALKRFLSAARPRGAQDVDVRVLLLFVISGMSALFTHRALGEKLGMPDPDRESTLVSNAEAIAELTVGGLFGSPGRPE
jgi:AcrR family transcriptional regulator